MNPAQLLNPKAYAKQKKSEQQKAEAARKGTAYGEQQQSPPQPRTQYDPSRLLNPRAAASSKSTRGEHDAEQQNVNGEGMGNLIERMHNVQNREAQTPRKRKLEIDLDDDEQRKKSTFNMNGGRNGGIIGDHLKKEREQIATGPLQQQQQNADAVDLTKDEDEEVVFLKERSNKQDTSYLNDEIVLGQISTKAMVHRIPDVSERSKSAVGADHWPRIRVNWRFTSGASNNNVIELTTKSGMFFGKIEFKAAQALTPLLKNRVGSITVVLESRPKNKSEQPGDPVSLLLPIACVITAPRNKAQVIGKHLSQRQLFLSAPMAAGGVHKEYENPQMPTDHRPVGNSDPSRKPQSQNAGTITVTNRTAEELRRDTNQLFDSLLQVEDLPEKEADETLIQTKLLHHQKQALHFLTDHEDPHQDGLTLWKEGRNARGQDYWYHVVTGHQFATMPEPLQGGILADMMGLGKTLSILSLVAATYREAKLFGQQQAPDACERNARCTLIICPKSVMANWTEQIKTHGVPTKWRVYSYHGTSRTQEVDELAKYHVVLTTYNTAAAEFNAKNKPLAAINWFRIVLDEAHAIRNQNTGVFKACVALHAQRRWAVTGTPVQNGLNDLGALIKFLKVKPFDEGPTWAQYIMAPFKLANTDVVQHLRLLVDSITIRRHKDAIQTTSKVVKIIRLEHTAEEQKWYSKVAGESSKKLKVMSANNSLKGKSYAHVLKSIGTLRMLCAHSLDMFSEEDRAEIKEGADAANAIDLGDEPEFDQDWQFISERNAYENLQMMSDSDVDRCSKCDRKVVPVKDTDPDEESEEEDEEDPEVLGFLTPCLHLICTECKDDHVQEIQALSTVDEYHNCQYCDSYVRFGLFKLLSETFHDFLDARNAKIKAPKGRKWDEGSYTGPHTKVKALVQDLKDSAVETSLLPEDEPPIRSVVFSGWTSYLNLIECALDIAGIGFLRLDGTMTLKQRREVLEAFSTDPTKPVMLVSIKAGGQGLNFTSANKVYMMEPQFNPGVEEQAIDRVHRLGQKRNVEVKRYIMTNTIEEGILKLQDKKKSLAELSMNRKMSAQQVRKENLEALKDLFK